MRYRLKEFKAIRLLTTLDFATGETGIGLLVLPRWRFLIRKNAGKRTNVCE
jgi:hypothetical protein